MRVCVRSCVRVCVPTFAGAGTGPSPAGYSRHRELVTFKAGQGPREGAISFYSKPFSFVSLLYRRAYIITVFKRQQMLSDPFCSFSAVGKEAGAESW